MIVEEIMNQNVVTLHPNDTIETAIRTIRTKAFGTFQLSIKIITS